MKRNIFIYALAVFFALVISEGFTSFMMTYKNTQIAYQMEVDKSK